MITVIIRVFLRFLLETPGEQTMLKAWKTVLKLKKEDFLFDLNGKPEMKRDSYCWEHFDKGAKLRVTIFNIDSVILQCNTGLHTRNTDIRDRDVIRYSPSNVKCRLYWEYNDVDSLWEAFNIRFQHQVLFVLRLFEVQQVGLLWRIWSAYIIWNL